jgi:hypothetical protein
MRKEFVLTLIVPWAKLVVLCQVWVRTERLTWGRGESQEASIVHVDITRMYKFTPHISVVKTKRCTSFANLFYSSTVHVSGGFSVHHQESKTVHTASGICQTDFADRLLAGTRWNESSISFPLASSQQTLFDIYLLLYLQS